MVITYRYRPVTVQHANCCCHINCRWRTWQEISGNITVKSRYNGLEYDGRNLCRIVDFIYAETL
jgi:hypothetical protein